MQQQTITWYSPREKLPQNEGLYLVRSDSEFGDPSIDMLYFCKNGRIEDGKLKEDGEGLHPQFYQALS